MFCNNRKTVAVMVDGRRDFSADIFSITQLPTSSDMQKLPAKFPLNGEGYG